MKNNNLPLVNIRGGFSDRNKIRCQNTIVQIDEFNEITRISLLNEIKIDIKLLERKNHRYGYNILTRMVNKFLLNVFHEEVNFDIEEYDIDQFIRDYIKPVIINYLYDSVLDIVEYFVNYYFEETKEDDIYQSFNKLFEREYVGYRFVNKQIVPITDEMEIEEIEKAVDENPFDNSKKLLQEALNKLSDRNNKDFAGCIHKSISAVESVCQSLLGEQKSLGDAIKKLEDNGIKMNGALKNALNTLYGWTSENGNIRHANIKNSDNPTFDEAKFMVVACSAFINYLISKKASLGGGNAN